MKKIILIVLICAIFLIGADDPVGLVRLTIINKSGGEIAIWLNGRYQEEFYYLTVEQGTRDFPKVKTFTIYKDVYDMQIGYIREWDPVYYYDPSNSPCPITPTKELLYATRNNRLTFTDCAGGFPRPGEPSMMKIWQGQYVNRQLLIEILKSQQ